MKKIGFDFDDTLVQYTKRVQDLSLLAYPQQYHFFYKDIEPIQEAVKLFKDLKALGHQVYIVTAMSTLNPYTYTGKRLAAQRLLGLEVLDNLIFINDKSMVELDVLLDDRTSGHGQDKIKGKLIHTPLGCDWSLIRESVFKCVS